MAAGVYDRDVADLANLQFKLLRLHQAQQWHAVSGNLASLCNFTTLALVVLQQAANTSSTLAQSTTIRTN